MHNMIDRAKNPRIATGVDNPGRDAGRGQRFNCAVDCETLRNTAKINQHAPITADAMGVEQYDVRCFAVEKTERIG